MTTKKDRAHAEALGQQRAALVEWKDEAIRLKKINKALVEALQGMVAAAAAPWQNLPNDPEAMAHVERLQRASRVAQAVLQEAA